MPPTQESIDRMTSKLRLTTPLIGLYDTNPSTEFEPLTEAKGRTCCFAYYNGWLQGRTVVFRSGSQSFGNPKHGCPGGQNAFGLGEGYPPFMAHFLTDGKGAPMGEGLKATPQLAQEFLDNSKPPKLSGDTILIGPLRLDQWNTVRSVTFFVDPDRLAALMTLAAFWSSDPDFIHAETGQECQ